MPFLQLLRKPSAIRSKFSIGSARNLLDRKTSTRCQSTNTNPTSTSKANGGHAASSKAYSRLDRVLDRFPKPLRRYTDALKGAPVTHVVSFLVLHEITAIVPLVGLSCLFHWGNWLPSVISQGSYVLEGVERFGRYFSRKGWFGFSRTSQPDTQHSIASESPAPTTETPTDSQRLHAAIATGNTEAEIGEVERAWSVGENGGRILIEVATAYAVTKVMLPVRILFSVWATPWFARVVLRGFRWGRS